MDEMMNRRLHEQETGLRAVMAVFSQADRRMAQLGDNVGWIGPASDAYGLGIHTLRAELRAAEDHLASALAATTNALQVSEFECGQGCG